MAIKTQTVPCDIEESLSAQGRTLCAMDEVGRGAWAGPLVLVALIPGPGVIQGVRDSKKISQPKRERLSTEIITWAKAIGYGVVTNIEIDEISMAKAITLGAQRALDDLERKSHKVDTVLLDGHYDFIRNVRYDVRTIIKGDNLSHAIAAASIVAKVYRDSYMASDEVAGRYKEFCFEQNKGYPSPVHKLALANLGPTPLHRVSWGIFGSISQNSEQQVLI